MTTERENAASLPWEKIRQALWESGFARLGILLSQAQCRALRRLYHEPGRFRSRIDMARHRFGRGEYQYFCHPQPEIVAGLRSALYPHLRKIANPWMAALGLDTSFPPRLKTFHKQCAARGQTRPTPLLLRYRDGDFNCLHQDIYGEIVFPFQVIIALSEPGREYGGGELLLVEQKPRAQSRGHVVHLAQGESLVISTRFRPIEGARGFYRAAMRHGVSTVTSGERFTLGIIFHDAK